MGYNRHRRKHRLDHNCNRTMDLRVLRMAKGSKQAKWAEINGTTQKRFTNDTLMTPVTIAGAEDETRRVASIYETKVIHRSKWKRLYGKYVKHRDQSFLTRINGASHLRVAPIGENERVEIPAHTPDQTAVAASSSSSPSSSDENENQGELNTKTEVAIARSGMVSVLYRQESRLDVVRHRSGLVPSRPTARQRIRHGHIQLTLPSQAKSVDSNNLNKSLDQTTDGRVSFVCRHPNYMLKPLTLVEVKEQTWTKLSERMDAVWNTENLENNFRGIPPYLHVDFEEGCVVFKDYPRDGEVMLPSNFDATILSRVKN